MIKTQNVVSQYANEVLRFVFNEAGPNMSLQNAIKNVVPSYDEKVLYRADSWKGKWVQWLRGYETTEIKEKRVCQLLWSALQAENLSLSPEKKILLLKHLQQKLPIQSSPEALHEKFSLLQEPTQEKKEIKRNLLIYNDTPVSAMTFQEVQEQFLLNLSCPAKQKELEEAEKRFSVFKKLMGLVDPQERHNIRWDEANEMIQEISKLPLEQGYLFLSRYGLPMCSLNDLLSLCIKMAELTSESPLLLADVKGAAKETIDETRKNIEWVYNKESHIQSYIETSIDQMASTLPLQEAAVLKETFQKTSREWFSSLPAPVQQFADTLLQGALGVSNLSETTKDGIDFAALVLTDHQMLPRWAVLLTRLVISALPSEKTLHSKLVHWLQVHGSALTTTNVLEQEKALKDLEKEIGKHANMTLDSFLDPVAQALAETVNCCTRLLPPDLSRLTGLDRLVKTGPLWFRWTRETEEEFCLEIYSDSQPLIYHQETGDHQFVWPKVVRGIKKTALTPELFEFLLYQTYEAPYSKRGFTADAIYTQVLHWTAGREDKKQLCSEEIISFAATDLSRLYVLGAQEYTDSALRRVNALIAYCRQFIQEDSLNFENFSEEERSWMKSALSKADNDLMILEHQDRDFVLEAKEALLEIGAALYTRNFLPQKVDLQSPSVIPLVQPVAKWLNSQGIELQNLQNYAELLEALFGSDMMPIFELIMQSMGSVSNDAFTPAASDQKSIGEWLKSHIKQIYQLSMMQVVRTLYFTYKLGTRSSLLLLLPIRDNFAIPLVDLLLPHRLQSMLHWVVATAEQIQFQIKKMVLSLILRLVLGNTASTKLEKLREILKINGRKILGQDLLSYEMKETPVDPPAIVALTPLAASIKSPLNMNSLVVKYLYNSSIIASGSISETLARCLYCAKNGHSDAALTFILQLIRQLPISQVNDTAPNATLDQIDQLIQLLKPFWSKIENSLEYPRFILAHFHLLALAEVLAKKDPTSKLQNYHIDATLFNLWIQSRACVLPDPDDLIYLESLQSYFQNRDTKNARQYGLCRIWDQGWNLISEADKNYLLALYSPETRDQILSKAIPAAVMRAEMPQKKSFFSYFWANGPSQYYLGNVYWEECIHKEESTLAALNHLALSKHMIIPIGYCTLRRLTDMILSKTTYLLEDVQEHEFAWGVEFVPESYECKSYKFHSVTHEIKARYVEKKEVNPDALIESNAYQASNSYSFQRRANARLKEPEIPVQQIDPHLRMSVQDSPQWHRKYDLTPHIFSRLSLAQTVALICQHQPVHFNTIASFLFHTNELKEQLKNAPGFIKTLALCYHKLMEQKQPLLALYLRRASLRYDKNAATLFELPFKPVNSELHQLLCLGYPSDDPSRLEDQCVQVILQSINLPPLTEMTDITSSLQRELEHFLAAWFSTMWDLLEKSAPFRKQLLTAFMDEDQKKQFDLPPDAFICDGSKVFVQNRVTGKTFDFIEGIKGSRAKRAVAPPSTDLLFLDTQSCTRLHQIFSLTGITIIYMENTPQPKKIVRIFGKTKIEIVVEEIAPGQFKIDEKDLPLIDMPLPETLAHFARFAPVDKIRCKRAQNTNSVSQIVISDYKLQFEVQLIQGEKRAVETKRYPAYWVDPIQSHPAVERLSSYLILRNEQGQRKVLVPGEQWKKAFHGYLREGMGPVSTLIPLTPDPTTELFSFDITDKNTLQSSDPRACIYLLQLYLLQTVVPFDINPSFRQETIRLAEEITIAFSELSRQGPVDLALWNQIMPFALLPDLLHQYRQIRMVLLAALEENRALHHITSSTYKKPAQEPPIIFSSLLSMLGILRDLSSLLNSNSTERHLAIGGGFTEDKEWFLYRALFRHSTECVNWRSFLPWYAEKWISPEALEALFEQYVLPASLHKRYQQLKEKYGVANTLSSKCLTLVQYVASAASALSVPMATPSNSWVGQAKSSMHSLINHYLPQTRPQLQTFLNLYREQLTLSEDQVVQLHSQIQPTLEYDVSLEAREFKTQDLTCYFLVYYNIALGACGQEKKKALLCLLESQQKRHDALINRLIDFLKNVCSYTKVLPTGKHLYDALILPSLFPKLPPEFLDTIEETTYRLTVILRDIPTYLDKNKWVESEFYNTINSQGKEETPSFIFWKRYGLVKKFPSILKPILCGQGSVPFDYPENLTRFLLEVADNPTRYPPPKDLMLGAKRIIDTDPLPLICYPEWASLWKKLLWRCNALNCITTTCTEVAPHATRYTIRQVVRAASSHLEMYARIPEALSKAISYASETIPLVSPYLSKGRQVLQYLKREEKEEISLCTTRPTSERATPYKELDEEDALFDNYLLQLFSIVFEKVEQPCKEHRFPALTYGSDTPPSVKALAGKINRSCDTYYQNFSPTKLLYKLKEQEGLYTIYNDLTNFIVKLEQTAQEEAAVFDQCVNPPHLKGKRPDMTLRQLIEYVTDGTLFRFAKEAALPAEVLQNIDWLVARYLLRLSRLQQLKRIKKSLETLAHIDCTKNRKAYDDIVGKIGDELLTKRAYTFESIPSPRLILRLLCFEAFSDKMLWDKQLVPTKKVLLEGEDDFVLELLMGMGKTDCLHPLFSIFFAGEEVLINIIPSAMLGVVTKRLSHIARLYFNKEVTVIQFDRDQCVDPEYLTALKILLARSIERHEIIIMTREDAQAFKLKLQEVLFDATEKNLTSYKNIDATLEGLREILRCLKTQGRLIGDEAHEEFYRGIELCWPLGKYQTVEVDTFRIIAECLVFLTQGTTQGTESVIYQALKNRKEKVIFTPAIAQEIARRYSQNADVISYLSDIKASRPKELEKEPHFRKLSLVRGVLTTLLPRIFEKKAQVSFGVGGSSFATPFDGNMSSEERSVYSSPDLTVAMTLIAYFVTGLSKKQMEQCIDILYHRIEQEVQLRKVPENQTAAYRHFAQFLPDLIVSNRYVETYLYGTLSSDKQHKLQSDPKIISLYVELCALPEIRFWKASIKSNSHDFASLFKAHIHSTGTPYNHGTYPNQLNLLEDPETLGMALHIAHNRCPADGIKELQSELPIHILQEVLEKYFKDPSLRFKALCDGSALLAGISSREVARNILSFITVHRSDLQGVVFFDKDATGRDQLYCWEVGSGSPILFQETTLAAHQRISYYDDKHCFAADISQDPAAKAVALVGPKERFYILLQEIFRMRGLKFTPKIAQDEETASEVQEVHYALSKEAIQIIRQMKQNNQDPIQFQDIILLTAFNQGTTTSEENYRSALEKTEHVLEQHFWQSLMETGSTQEMKAFFASNKGRWIHELELDPIKNYGASTFDENPNTLIESAKKRCLYESGDATQEKLDQLKSYSYPATVTAYTNGADPSRMLDSVATMSLQQEQNQEQHQQQQQQQQNTVSSRRKIIEKQFFEETLWPAHFNPYQTDWQKRITSPQRWKITDTLSSKKSLGQGRLQTCFDRRLWISDNLLPTRLNADIGGVQQGNLLNLLVHAQKNNQKLKYISVGALSVADANHWINRLKACSPNKKDLYFIYDTQNSREVWSDDPNHDLSIDPEFLNLVVQLKFLDGNLNQYTSLEKEALMSWIEKHKDHAADLYLALQEIHENRSFYEPLIDSMLHTALSYHTTTTISLSQELLQKQPSITPQNPCYLQKPIHIRTTPFQFSHLQRVFLNIKPVAIKDQPFTLKTNISNFSEK